MRPLIRILGSPEARDTHPRQTDDEPITLPDTTELLARTITLSAADVVLEKVRAAQIEQRRAALLAVLVFEQEPEALCTERPLHNIAGRPA
jgi:hypothetical protein